MITMEPKTKNLAIEGIIRDRIDVRKLGLTFVEKEYPTTLGRIDILSMDEHGNKIPIEIKIGCAGDSAVGQVLGYMKAVGAIRGIIMANSFSNRVEAVSQSLGIDLYPFQFDVMVSGKSVVFNHEDIITTNEPTPDHIQEFITACCDRGGFIEPGTFYHAYTRWHKETHGVAPKEYPSVITKQRNRYGFGKEARKTYTNININRWGGKKSIKCYTGIHLKNTIGNLSVYPDYVDAHWHEITGNL